jgi:hypothetical protein
VSFLDLERENPLAITFAEQMLMLIMFSLHDNNLLGGSKRRKYHAITTHNSPIKIDEEPHHCQAVTRRRL